MSRRRMVVATAAALAAVTPLLAGDSAVDLPAPSTDVPAAAAPAPEVPAIGYRFAPLSASQQGALRARFRLPMDALLSAASPQQLRAAAVVQPLPDLNRPLLPVNGGVAGAESGGDPFVDGGETASDPTEFNVLQKLFAADNAAAASIEDAAVDDFASDPDGFEGDVFDTPIDSGAAGGSDSELGDDAAMDEFDDPFADF
ncbi:MAG: hypothetical protein AAFV43_07125 [Planctomycetota bacterium]